MASRKSSLGPNVSQPEESFWLSALAHPNHSRDAVVDLLKATQQPMNEVEKAIKKAKALGFKRGVRVRLHGDSEIGEVVGHNQKDRGFYSGDRYPILVKFEKGTFEYGVESLELG
jgi:hypothetical protein